MKNRQILKCGTVDLSYVEQKRKWTHFVGEELTERTDLILDGHNK